MKTLRYFALFCAVIFGMSACTKEIDKDYVSNECSILDIRLHGQLGNAEIKRTDDAKGEITIFIFADENYPWSKVTVDALVLSSRATSTADGAAVLNFSNPDRKATVTVTAESGRKVKWTIYLKPYDAFYVGTWRIEDVKIYIDQNISGCGTGKWDTSMGGSEFGIFARPELDNIITITMEPELVGGEFVGKITNDAGADGAYGQFKGVYAGEYTEDAPLDMTSRLRHLLPAGTSDWTLNLSTNEMRITHNNISSVLTFGTDQWGNTTLDFALPDASGDVGGSNFYDNFWRSSYKFSYIIRKVQ